MKNIVVGTAGHVDHGKTELIKALTGTDTDRLKEEKERGMTIDLGFASLMLPNGQIVSIVDVPGHERFVKNMLAGAGGIDVALVVVAVDESIMPQTREHLEILTLLEVRRGVVALTKIDLVDRDFVEYVRDEVRQGISDTSLAGSPIVPVSSITGEGIPELLTVLQDVCDTVQPKDTSGPFRMPIDRVFTLTGFGTVVTGTLVSGTVRVGDSVEIFPSGVHSRIRQLQVHGRKVETAFAGTRLAMNLAGVDVADISRGDVCGMPGSLKPANMLDVKFVLLRDAPRPLGNRSRVRMHIGTAEVLGRLVLLDRDELVPGDEAVAQFRCESRVAVERGDRFVIRSYSPMLTIGGGSVIGSSSRRRRRYDSATFSTLEASSRGVPEDLVEQALRQLPSGGFVSELSRETGIVDVTEPLARLKERGIAVDLGEGRIIHSAVLAEVTEGVLTALRRFHSAHPLRLGMPKEELRVTAAKQFDRRSFSRLVAYMEEQGVVVQFGATVYLPQHTVKLTPNQEAAAQKMLSELLSAGFAVPSAEELLRDSGVLLPVAKEILELLVARGQVVRVGENLYFHADIVTKAEQVLREHIERYGSITLSQFRDLTNSSRRYALALLEYFDSKRITRRIGDTRELFRPLSD